MGSGFHGDITMTGIQQFPNLFTGNQSFLETGAFQKTLGKGVGILAVKIA